MFFVMILFCISSMRKSEDFKDFIDFRNQIDIKISRNHDFLQEIMISCIPGACTPQSLAGFQKFSSVFELRLKHCCVYCLAVCVWLISALAAAFLRAVRRWRADVLRRRKRKHIHIVLLAHPTIQFRMWCNSVCGLCLKLQPMSCCRLCVVVWTQTKGLDVSCTPGWWRFLQIGNVSRESNWSILLYTRWWFLGVDNLMFLTVFPNHTQLHLAKRSTNDSWCHFLQF